MTTPLHECVAPLVAVPGLGLSGAVVDPTLDRVRRPSAVVLLPGFGLPAGPEVSLRPEDLARRLLHRLDDLGHGHVVLLGHSASCQIVVHAALDAPERVRALVLVGPTTDPSAPSWAGLAARWLRTTAWEPPRHVPLYVRTYRRTGLRTMYRALDEARHDRIDTALLHTDVPVLVVRGRRDRISPRAWTEDLVSARRRGRAVTLGAGAHMVPLTRHAELASTVVSFLEQVEVAPPRPS